EALMVANERFDLERLRDEAAARLNGLLDRPASAPLPPLSSRPALTPLPGAEELIARALEQRADVRRTRAELRAAGARLGGAQRTPGWGGRGERPPGGPRRGPPTG